MIAFATWIFERAQPLELLVYSNGLRLKVCTKATSKKIRASCPFCISFCLTVAPFDVDVDAHLDPGEGLVVDAAGSGAATARRRHLHRESVHRLHSLHRPCSDHGSFGFVSSVYGGRDRLFGVTLRAASRGPGTPGRGLRGPLRRSQLLKTLELFEVWERRRNEVTGGKESAASAVVLLLLLQTAPAAQAGSDGRVQFSPAVTGGALAPSAPLPQRGEQRGPDRRRRGAGGRGARAGEGPAVAVDQRTDPARHLYSVADDSSHSHTIHAAAGLATD